MQAQIKGCWRTATRSSCGGFGRRRAQPARPDASTLRSWTKERKEDQDSRDEKLIEKVDELRRRPPSSTGLDQGRRRWRRPRRRGRGRGAASRSASHRALERIAAGRGDAHPTPGATAPRAAARRATRWSSSAPATGPPLAGSSSRRRTRQPPRTRPGKQLNECDGRARRFVRPRRRRRGQRPRGRETLTEYEGNKMIVAVDRDEPDGLVARNGLPARRGAGSRRRGTRSDASTHRQCGTLPRKRRPV